MDIKDEFFRVEVISKTLSPQTTVWFALHQCYSEDFVFDETPPPEEKSGEIVVKRLLEGKKGHYGCYSADTEVLTEKGWQRWDELDRSLRLLAVDIKRNECFFEKPSGYQEVEFVEGDRLYSVSSQYIDFAVTGDHRMVVSHKQKTGGFSGWYFRNAEDCHGSPVRYLLSSCLAEAERSLPTDLPDCDLSLAFKLAGFFFGDGIRTNNKKPGCVRFKLRLPRKIAYLYSLGLDVREKQDDRFTVPDKSLAQWIHRNFSNAEGKTVPEWLMFLPMKELASFWDGLKNSDGTNITDKSWCYDSCDKKALDIIQATAHINGFSANMMLNRPSKSINHRDGWRLRINEMSTKRVETCQDRSPGVKEEWTEYTGKVFCATVSTGALMVRRNGKVIVSGNCLENPSITFNVGWFPHSVMQQATRHRLATFDVQSMRFSGNRIIDVADGKRSVESVFYLRPVGHYHDRVGNKYFYSQEEREEDLIDCHLAACRYKEKTEAGMSPEHARGSIPFDFRQHFIVSMNMRSLMHFLLIRGKKDAQLEIQQLAWLMLPHFKDWAPQVYDWFMENEWLKGFLAP